MPRSPNVRPRLDVVALLIATVTLLLVAGQMAVPRLREEPVYRATALADGMVDIDLLVPRVNLDDATTEARPGRPVNVLSSVPEGQSLPAVELLEGWDDDNFRRGAVQVWCIRGDPQVQQVIREGLQVLATAFPFNLRWREDCANARYTAGEGTAARDCGLASALGCATRLSSTSGKVSHNPTYIDTRSNRLQLLRVIYSHELAHIVYGASHNPCSVIRSPDTGQPVPSVMTPISIENGSSCSIPPAYGAVEADWYYVWDHYGIPRNQELYQVWWWKGWNGEAVCPVDAPEWANWCVRTGREPAVPPSGAWRMRVEQQPDGSLRWVSDWEFVWPR
jgi:hypothetical protein